VNYSGVVNVSGISGIFFMGSPLLSSI